MTAAVQENELMTALATELQSMDTDNAERLCTILKGLFTCMQDLNLRVALLEKQCASVGRGEN